MKQGLKGVCNFFFHFTEIGPQRISSLFLRDIPSLLLLFSFLAEWDWICSYSAGTPCSAWEACSPIMGVGHRHSTWSVWNGRKKLYRTRENDKNYRYWNLVETPKLIFLPLWKASKKACNEHGRNESFEDFLQKGKIAPFSMLGKNLPNLPNLQNHR